MIKSAFDYHESTNYDRKNMSGHYLDWKNQPMVFKDYPGVMPIVLPTEVNFPDIGIFDLIHKVRQVETKESIDFQDLSSIFRLSYSLTARARQGGGDFFFRSAASAGALYPCELYVATHGVNDLEDGLYHFAIHRHCLYPLRKGDTTFFLARALQTDMKNKPMLTFILSVIYFRSAWKYRERSYRYHLLDTGHLLENLVLALNSLGLECDIKFDFNDDAINHILGFNEGKEVSLAAVCISGQELLTEEDSEIPENLSSSYSMASQVAAKETNYPSVKEVHQAGKLIQSSESQPVFYKQLGLSVEEWVKNKINYDLPEHMNYVDAVYQRRSKRNFVQKPLARNQLDLLIDALCRTDMGPRSETNYFDTFNIGLLINQVEGMDPGFYMLDLNNHTIGLAKPGHYSQQIARVCLDQAWLANTAVHVLFLTNLKLLDESYGPRGYRYAMMTAGRLGQRIYLVATALGLGCCGIGAFYDREASELLELNKKSQLLYLVAFGPVKRGS